MYIADTLSRAAISETDNADVDRMSELSDDIDVIVHSLLYEFPASNQRMEKFRQKTADDPVLMQLKEIVRHEFSRDVLPDNVKLKTYLQFISDIYELNGLLLIHGKLIVPVSMRCEILKLLHE